VTFRSVHIGLDDILITVIIALALALVLIGKREKGIVIPPTITEGWASQVTQQAYLIVKDKQVIAICSRKESAEKYAKERDAAAFTVGINNGSDIILELKRDGEKLTLNIASW